MAQGKHERKKNEPEEALRLLARRRGWEPYKRGWPDFFCQRGDGTWCVVEVKRRLPSGKLVMLKREQEMILTAMSSIGVECFVSDGKILYRYDPKKHASKKRRRKGTKRSCQYPK